MSIIFKINLYGTYFPKSSYFSFFGNLTARVLFFYLYNSSTKTIAPMDIFPRTKATE